MTLLTGALGIGIFQLLELLEQKYGFLYQLSVHKEAVAQILASFAFTPLGFLATIITFLFGLSEKPFFRSYIHHGHMANFLFAYFLIMASLFVTFVTSVGSVYSRPLLDVSISAGLLNVCQLLFISFVGFNVTKRSLPRSAD